MPSLLLKTEPSEYAFADLVRDGHALWDGITNAAALGHLRTARRGQKVLIYHTGEERAIVGLAEVTADPREDPKHPGRNSRGEIARPVIEIRPVRAARAPVSLAQLKADSRFKDFALLRQSRLSVVPVPADLRPILRKLAGL